MAESVWVLWYHNQCDENDNGVLGVYATEQLARDAGIEKKIKALPHLINKNVRWEGEDLVHGNSYLFDGRYHVEEWEVSRP